jgi:ATP-dependent RNA helicase DeaD
MDNRPPEAPEAADNTGEAQNQPIQNATETDGAEQADSDTVAEPSFDDLQLAAPVASAIAELGYETPTPIQQRCIPHLLAGRDLLGQAQTGTGKTAAFALPLLSRLEAEPNDEGERLPRVLALTPTRELALQVAEAFQRYARHIPDFHVLPIYGGQSYSLQNRQLRRAPRVIVGTPGRIMDHLRRGSLSLAGLRALVLDEADEMLKMGFADEVDAIFEHCPDGVQTALFSATMPDTIRRVARTRMHDPVEVKIKSKAATVETIEQRHCVVTRWHKLDVLTRILEMEPFDGMVIFVRTKHGSEELADRLQAHGFAAEPINGDLSQDQRERAIGRLRDGSLDILVATDVAARGLDVERISHVVNYDIPTDPSAYVHRVGRTGRAGRAGRAILLVEPRERGLLRAIERVTGQRVAPMEPPSAAELSASRIDRFVDDLRRTLAEQDMDFFYRLIDRLSKEQELDLMDMAAAMSFLLQRDRPLEVADDAPKRQPHREGERAFKPRGERPPGPRDRDRDRDRGDRDDDRPRRPRRPDRGGSIDQVTYRIAVGHRDGVGPREIVGAIANEAGLDGKHIGRIDIRDDHSLVDLPEIPKEIFRHLQGVRVNGQPLRISRADPDDLAAPRRPRDDWRGGDRRPPRGSDSWHGDRPRRDRDRDSNGDRDHRRARDMDSPGDRERSRDHYAERGWDRSRSADRSQPSHGRDRDRDDRYRSPQKRRDDRYTWRKPED